MPPNEYYVLSAAGRELARFDMSNTPPDRDGDICPMSAALAVLKRGKRCRVYRGDGRLMATGVAATVWQPIDTFGSGRGRRAA